MKQLTAFFDGHHREFTVGAANQQTVSNPDQSRVQYFHVTPESRSAPLAVNGVTVMLKNTAQAFTAFIDIFHFSFLTAV